jgi:hypothetical protein
MNTRKKRGRRGSSPPVLGTGFGAIGVPRLPHSGEVTSPKGACVCTPSLVYFRLLDGTLCDEAVCLFGFGRKLHNHGRHSCFLSQAE